MKRVCSVVFSLFVAVTSWGQTKPSAAAASTTPLNQPAPSAGLQDQPSPADANDLRMQRMLRLYGELKAMRSKLDEMKANAAKVNDPALKQQLQLENSCGQ